MKARAWPRARNPLALAVRIQPKDKTLTDAEIEALAQKIVAAALKLGATFELTRMARGFDSKSALGIRHRLRLCQPVRRRRL